MRMGRRGCWRPSLVANGSRPRAQHCPQEHSNVPSEVITRAKPVSRHKATQHKKNGIQIRRFGPRPTHSVVDTQTFVQGRLGKSILKYYISLMLFCQTPPRSPKSMNADLESLQQRVGYDLSKQNSAKRIIGILPRNCPDKTQGIVDASATRKPLKHKFVHQASMLLSRASSWRSHRMVHENTLVQLMSKAIPEIQWMKTYEFVNNARNSASRTPQSKKFIGRYQDQSATEKDIECVEKCINYTFRAKSLALEAMTPGKFHDGKPTYERLEFLGDAVIELILSHRLVNMPGEPLVHPGKIYTALHALVNEYLLAFLAMNVTVSLEPQKEALKNDPLQTKRLVDCIQSKPDSYSPTRQRNVEDNFQAVCSNVWYALEKGDIYPWIILRNIKAPKAYCDFIEALVAAVYVDSGADLRKCERVLEHIGLLKILRLIGTRSSFDLHDSLTRLQRALGHRTNQLVLSCKTSGRRIKDNLKFTSRVKLDNELIAECSSTVSQTQADSLAAEAALAKLYPKSQAQK